MNTTPKFLAPTLVAVLTVFVIPTLSQAVETPAAANPLLAEWSGPHGGVPPFDQVKVADFKPALETAITENRREIEAIASNPEPASFANTLVAMDRAGRTLARVSAIYDTWSASEKSPEFQKVELEMAPKLAAFRDEISHHSGLFKRIQAVYDSPDKAKLSPEQQRLVWYVYTQFVRQGAKLTDSQKSHMSEINQRLAGLYTQFSQNELADEEGGKLVIEKQADLAGLPASQIEALSAEAERRGMKGKWVVANTRSSMEPFLSYSSNRPLREAAFRIWTQRGDQSGPHDNNPLVTEILRLRLERSKLLGYPTYAHWHLADTMAKEPSHAMDLMLQVWKPAVETAHQEVADMQAIVDREHAHDPGGFKIEPWDYRYYAEKVRLAKYDLYFNLVKPYLRLDQIRKAMFWVAGKLYGFTFTKLEGIPVFERSMSVYEVKGREGQHVGLWYFDPYARAGKNSGAWMNAYREQENDDKPITTIVSNNANFIPGKPGEPVTISWGDAVTMFHEFGHALHGLCSNVTYRMLSGTNVAGDFVEFPSQVNENWIETKEVQAFLTDQKGRKMPKKMLGKIARAKTFNQGFASTEFLASAIVDMKLHLREDAINDPRAFETATLAELGMPPQIVMRHRIPQFGHVFSGEEYAAGYYGYLWAEVLDHDAFEAFTEAGGPYDPAVAKRFFDHITSVGNTVDPAEAYRAFRGRDPVVNALLRARGFPVAPTPGGS